MKFGEQNQNKIGVHLGVVFDVVIRVVIRVVFDVVIRVVIRVVFDVVNCMVFGVFSIWWKIVHL